MFDLLELLDSVLGVHKNHPKGEFYYLCPFCNHQSPKLAVNLEKHGVWHCWHCNDRGSIVQLFKKLNCTKEEIAQLYKLLGEDRSHNATEDVTPSILMLPPEYQPLWKRPTSLNFSYKSAMQYIINRGITAADILRYQIGYCAEGHYANRIVMPSYDNTGRLNYFTARSFYSNDGLKYKNPPISKNVIVFDFHINWSHEIVLCEGMYDALAIKRNAIPLLGKTIPNKLAEKIETKNVSDITLVLDNDALHATAEIASRFIQNGKTVRVVSLDKKDPSEVGFVGMSELIKTANPLSFAELIKMRVTA
jgi:DNA primase